MMIDQKSRTENKTQIFMNSFHSNNFLEHQIMVIKLKFSQFQPEELLEDFRKINTESQIKLFVTVILEDLAEDLSGNVRREDNVSFSS